MLLEVRVISASNLARADVGPCPDIFVVLGFGNTSPIQRTNVCYNAVAPSWGEVFRFAVRDQCKEYLNVILKSKNADDMDDAISFREVSVSDLRPGELSERDVDLTPVNGIRRGGRLRLNLRLFSDPDCGCDTPTSVFTRQPQRVIPRVEEVEYVRPKPLIGQGGVKKGTVKREKPAQVKKEPRMPVLPQVLMKAPISAPQNQPVQYQNRVASFNRGKIEIMFQGMPFEGIFAYLGKICKGNVVDHGIVGIAARDRLGDAFHEKAVLDGGPEMYVSANEPGAWFCVDFRARAVYVSHYSIRGGDYAGTGEWLSSWALDGSRDGLLWEEIQNVAGAEFPNAGKIDVTCRVVSQRAYRFLRLRMTGPNRAGNYVLCCGRFEVFGVLLDLTCVNS